jgi:hypothetical protein
MDDERSTDTSETFDETPGAGGVSSQNHEEGSAPGEGGSGGGREEVSQDDRGAERAGREDSSGNADTPGGAGEGSQATGSRSGAG